MGQDMELLEIKFELEAASDAVLNGFGMPLGGSIWCDLSMGSLKLTNGAVPVWSFGRAENLSGETKFGQGATQRLSYNGYTWRLPRPLYVPAGTVVAPSFSHTGFVPGNINVRIGYSGRTITKKPKVAYVPWVTAYASPAFNPITAAIKVASTEQDLINLTDKPIHLQRFVGRTFFTDQDGRVWEHQPYSLGSQYLTMRMNDSYGRPLVRNYTPFRSVFGALTRSWELEELGAQLDPQAYYRVFLNKAAMVMNLDQQTAQAQAFISMVGWREETT
jgi:hypothetical protein